MNTNAYIYDHVRTPRGKGRSDGALHEITPVRLAAQVLAAIRDRNAVDTELIEDVILGCTNPFSEQGANIARTVALVAGYGQHVPGIQIDRYCASGLETMNLAAAQVMSGQVHAIVAGGVESMSRVAPLSGGGAWCSDPQVIWEAYFTPTGVSADLLATLDDYSREALDGYGLQSQQRCAEASAAGRFDRAIVPVKDILGEVVLARDEFPCPGTTMESLAALKPAFDVVGEQGGFDAVALLCRSGQRALPDAGRSSRGQDTSELFLDNVRVPADNLLGGEAHENKGFVCLMEQLPWERLGIAIAAVAAAQAAIDRTIAYVKERKTFGQAVAAFQNTRFTLAELQTEVQMARVFVDKCCELLIQEKHDTATASMAKYWCSDLQCRVMDECVQLMEAMATCGSTPLPGPMPMPAYSVFTVERTRS